MSGGKSTESSFSRILTVCETTLVTVALMGMIVVVFFQVFFRYAVTYSLPWSEEVSRYLMVWVVFIGASLGARQGVHIGVTALVDALPKSFQKIAAILEGLACATFCLTLAWAGYMVILKIKKMGQLSPAMEMPMWIAYLPIMVGSILMALRFLQAMIIKYKSKNYPQVPVCDATEAEASI